MIDNDPASEGFNSYGSVAGLLDYAKTRGYDVPEEAAEGLLMQAMDYLGLQTWAGRPTSADQPLPWPRSGVRVDGLLIPSDKIPQKLIQAQYLLAVLAQEVDLMPGYGGAQALEETVSGAVSIKYSESSLGSGVHFPWLRSMLAGLLGAGGASAVQFSVRRG